MAKLVDSHTRCIARNSHMHVTCTLWPHGAGQKLREASEQQQFNREVDDLNLWLTETEAHLASENLGNVRG